MCLKRPAGAQKYFSRGSCRETCQPAPHCFDRQQTISGVSDLIFFMVSGMSPNMVLGCFYKSEEYKLELVFMGVFWQINSSSIPLQITLFCTRLHINYILCETTCKKRTCCILSVKQTTCSKSGFKCMCCRAATTDISISILVNKNS